MIGAASVNFQQPIFEPQNLQGVFYFFMLICNHIYNSAIASMNPEETKLWLFLMARSDADGFFWVHHKVIPGLARITDAGCENGLKKLASVGYFPDSEPIVYLGDDSVGLMVTPWHCKCITKERSRYIPQTIRAQVLSIGYCVKCGSKERLTVDHIFPFVLGGTNVIENLQCLCFPCNARKHAKIEPAILTINQRKTV